MYAFDYEKAASVEAAAKALEADDEAKLMAGGQTLIPTLKQRLAQPTKVIDLQGIADLVFIEEKDGEIQIGAMTTHAAVARSELVKAAIPGLAELAGMIGDDQVRHKGTIGGSIANNDPAADYPAALVALNAHVVTTKRILQAEEFFTGMFETALDEDEIVKAVHFPKGAKANYQKFPNPASRYAIVGVMVAAGPDGARVAVTGAGECVFRAGAIEAALAGGLDPAAVEGVEIAADGLNEDIHAGADYRAHLIKVMAKRAVAALA